MIIAIDGPAASGKGTLAKRIADHWGLPCLDTGLLYRAVARDVAPRGFRLDDALGGARRWPAASIRRRSTIPRLRTPQAGDAASIVARIPQVRAALLAYQRAFAAPARRRGARRPRHRHRRLPRRRRQDLRHRPPGGARQTPFSRVPGAGPRPSPSRPSWPTSCAGTSATPRRGSAPMRPAADADLLDTSDLDIEAAFDAAVGLIKRKIGQ